MNHKNPSVARPTIIQITSKVATMLLLALMVYFLLPAQAKAQSTVWTTPEIMGESWFPDITTDSTGTVYLAWAAGDPAYDLVMFTYKEEGGIWSVPNDVQAMAAPVGRYATRPAMLIDPYGVLHLSYRGDTIWYTHVPLQQANNSQAWAMPQNIAGGGYFSKLVYTSDGTLHLFFTENQVRAECTNCFHLMYQNSKDGETWTSPNDITPALEGMAKPQIIVDAQDNLYVVFEAGYGGDLGQLADPATVVYMISRDGGESWTNPTPFAPERGDNPNAQARNIALAIDGTQKLIAVWWAIPEDTIYYQTSQDQGQSWSSPTPIAGVAGGWSIYQSRLDDFTMATDSAGHVHLVMSGRRALDEPNHSLLHLEWDGANWSTPVTIATYQGDVPEWPRLAIGNGNQLHLAWFVRDHANLFKADTSNYRIWYALGEAAAPYIAPIALAMPTPTSLVSVEASSQETLPMTTPATLLDAHLQQPPTQSVTLDSLMTEQDDISLLVMSLLPTMLLMGLVTLVRRLRKNH